MSSGCHGWLQTPLKTLPRSPTRNGLNPHSHPNTPTRQVLDMARKMAGAGINLLVIDTENKFVGNGEAGPHSRISPTHAYHPAAVPALLRSLMHLRRSLARYVVLAATLCLTDRHAAALKAWGQSVAWAAAGRRATRP